MPSPLARPPAQTAGSSPDQPLALAIIGGGPAGVGVLLAAAGRGMLPALVTAGVALFDGSHDIGPGDLGRYAITSDSHAESFLKCVEEPDLDNPLAPLAGHPAARRLAERRGASVPLTWAAQLQAPLVAHLERLTDELGARVIRGGLEVTCARRTPEGTWQLSLRDADGITQPGVAARSLVIATGARQDETTLAGTVVAGVDVTGDLGARTIGSAALLEHDGLGTVRARLGDLAHPRVVIVGGSHSALSSAARLLDADPPLALDEASISIVHREPLRVTWPGPQEARQAGFTDFTDADICPITGRVFPLAGFRGRSRELALRLTGLAGSPPEPRVRLVPLTAAAGAEPVGDAAVAELLRGADLIVLATGYRPRGLRLVDVDGTAIPLRIDVDPGAPMVDGRSRVLGADARPVPGVFGIGLAAGYPLAGSHGEPSFTGQANGMALWQTTIGRDIVVDALAAAHRPVVRTVPTEALASEAAVIIAEVLARAIAERGHAVFVPSAGRTPTATYRCLVNQHRDSLDWSRVTLVQMDEFAGMPPSDPRSYAAYLRRHLVDPLRIGSAIWLCTERGELALSIERLARAVGTVDLVVHGIGSNGHVGFNEPGTSRDWVGGTVELAPSTVAASTPRGADDSPYRLGHTLGLAVLTRARASVLLATGASKAEAVGEFLSGQVGDHCPAAHLRTAASLTVLLDIEAAAHLNRTESAR